MQIIELRIEELTPYENNPRNNDNAVESVVQSIREFGFKQPIVADVNRVIVCGHTRYKAAQLLGLETVPVLIADDLSEEQINAYRLADNKVGELAGWDFDLLTEELEAIQNIDMELFGFELDEGTGEAPETAEEDDYTEDDVIKERAKHGDIWKLDGHRVMCGDSTSPTDVAKLMGGAVADLVFTDPPYGLKKEKDGVENDNLNFDDLLEFNRKWIAVALDNLKYAGCAYIWGFDEPLMDIYANILKPLKRENKAVIRNYITWCKHSAYGVNWADALSYPKESEKCWFFMKGMDWNNNNSEFFNTKFEKVLAYMMQQAEQFKITQAKLRQACGCQMFSHWFSKSQFCIIPEKHYNELREFFPGSFEMPYNELRGLVGEDDNKNVKMYFDNVAKEDIGGIGLTDVWRFPQVQGQERTDAGGHATPKPIKLCARGIVASTRKGENVLDLFGGSGSTLIACEQLDRHAFLMELEPHWVDVIIHRWEKATGKTAELLEG